MNAMIIVMAGIEARLDRTLPIVERLKQSMVLVRKSDVNWLGLDESQQFSCAVGAVLSTATEDEKAIIRQEMDFLKRLSAMAYASNMGVSANIESLFSLEDEPEKWFGLQKLWMKQKKET